MTNRQDNRARQILDYLSRAGKADVATLAGSLGVSCVTLRKDLDALEGRGFIIRSHGYAALAPSDRIAGRLAWHYPEKRKIAEKAASLVQNGDTVMIESGSCCAILADILAQDRRDITIITNSAFIADYIREHRSARVILLGGLYQPDSQCLVGPMIRDGADAFHVRYFFAGTDGWTGSTGFTNKDPLRAQAVRDMAHACDEMVILTESEKFLSAGTTPLAAKSQPRIVITDSGIPREAVDSLLSQGITVVDAGA